MDQENGVPSMKMSVVGCEASGKTVFLSALADYYNGDGRPCLVPENEAANRFQRFQLRQMRGLRQWPPATDPGKTVELRWSLREDGKTVSEIEMLEFGGETYREAFRGEKSSESHQEAVDILSNHLAGSEFVVVLVSLKELLREPGELTSEEFERDTEALWVTRGLLEFMRERAPEAKIVVGLTQADLHRSEIESAGGAAELFRKRWPSIAAVANGSPVVPVASVSATDENGNPAQGYTTDGILTVMNEFREEPRRTEHDEDAPVRSASGGRRTLLLVLLLFATGALYLQYGQPEAVTTTPDVVTRTVIRTNTVENIITSTNIIENVVERTNVVENLVVLTNIIENTVVKTNFVEQAVTTNGMPSVRSREGLRTWHDHRGTPIDATWIETTDDRKRIIIETVDGKRIRASIRKFSEADQKYILERMNADGGGTATSTDPTL